MTLPLSLVSDFVVCDDVVVGTLDSLSNLLHIACNVLTDGAAL